MANVVAVGLLGRLCDQAAAEQHPAAVPLRIWRAVQWIEENFATKVSIEKLAVQAGLSPRHFARSFLQATGYTPHAYLLRIWSKPVGALAGSEPPWLQLSLRHTQKK
jgi:hypothetical protein